MFTSNKFKINEFFKYAWEYIYKPKYRFGYIALLFGLITVIRPLISELFTLDYALSLTSTILIIIGFFLIFYLFALVITLYRISLLEKSTFHGDVIIILKDFFSKIQLIRKLEGVNPDILMTPLLEVCNKLKISFDDKTKSSCCVSIKLFENITSDGNISSDGIVYNFCRDENTKPLRDTEIYKKITHTVFKNTPYFDITRSISDAHDMPFYINNDIPKDVKAGNYMNSSMEAYADQKLPYKSEIVIPLIPLTNEDKSALLGFICIDSNKKNSFGTKYDIPMLQGVADGVYDVIMKINFN